MQSELAFAGRFGVGQEKAPVAGDRGWEEHLTWFSSADADFLLDTAWGRRVKSDSNCLRREEGTDGRSQPMLGLSRQLREQGKGRASLARICLFQACPPYAGSHRARFILFFCARCTMPERPVEGQDRPPSIGGVRTNYFGNPCWSMSKKEGNIMRTKLLYCPILLLLVLVVHFSNNVG